MGIDDLNFQTELIGSQLEFYQMQGFDNMQLEEIEKGLKSEVDISAYGNPRFMFLQMAEIRKGLENGVDVSIYADEKYDWLQMEEIRLGLESKLDVSIYANKNIDYLFMREVRKGLLVDINLMPYVEKGLPMSILKEVRKSFADGVNILKYIRDGYVGDQLAQIREGLKSHIDIKPFLNTMFSADQMNELRIGIEEGLDISVYNDENLNWMQMHEIRIGLEKKIDVSKYSNYLYSPKQMREIRLGLEANLNVDEYRSLIWSENDMKHFRLRLYRPEEYELEGLSDEVETVAYDETDLEKEIFEYSVDEIESQNISIEEESVFDIEVTEDEMKAYLIVPVTDEKVMYSEKMIDQILKQKGIRQGIIKNNFSLVLDGKIPEDGKVLIAEGRMATDGKDGYYELFFKTNRDSKPKLNEDGSVDYKNIDLFELVEEGQTLAVYHNATNGVYGYTTKGRLIHPTKGKDLSRLKGNGFKLMDDEITYICQTTGSIEYEDGTINIKTVYTVNGDVHMSMGNIKFKGDVYIKGDVGTGVTIEAEGNVTINGNVESALIKAGENVLIRSGVSAKGIGIIEAGKNIYGKYFEKVKLIAQGNIESNYLFNCNAIAMNKVIVSGEKGAIVGGTTAAIYGVETSVIGNQSEIKTIFELGSNRYFEDKLRKFYNEEEEYSRKIIIFREELKKIQMQRKLDIFKRSNIYQSIQTAIIQLAEQVAQVKEERDAFVAELGQKSAGIGVRVSNKAYSGCLITINKAKLLLASDYEHVFFREHNEVVTPFLL